MALPLGDYPCHHLDHGPDTVEVHREDYEIALDAKEKLKVATGTIRKLRILYAKVQRRYWMEIVDNEQCLPEFNSGNVSWKSWKLNEGPYRGICRYIPVGPPEDTP